MARKIERPINSRGTGTPKGKGQQDSVASVRVIKTTADLTPLLVDANEGARILGISLSTFYKFTRRNETTPMILIGSLQRWKKQDLLRLTGKPSDYTIAEDFLIDAKIAAMLCSVSRPMFYKLNHEGMVPEPLLDGRTLRWSVQDIGVWIEAGCPNGTTKGGIRK